MTFSIGGHCWDLDCVRDRLWTWWNRLRNEHGRHGRRAFDRDMDQLEQEIRSRRWTPPAEPVPKPEWTAEAILRSYTPRLYAPDGEYWRDQWAHMARWMSEWRAASAAHRIECGLPS